MCKEAFDNNKLTYMVIIKEPDYELIVAGAPSIAVYSTMLSSVPEVAAKLKELGVNYILDQSTYEDEPLGRVEWAKFYAAFCDQEESAEKMFNQQDEYITKLSNVEKTGKKVAVFYITSKGKLYVRNAGDYLAKMVNMAGGEYFLTILILIRQEHRLWKWKSSMILQKMLIILYIYGVLVVSHQRLLILQDITAHYQSLRL